MIVLNVLYKCKTGKREAFLDAIKKEGIDAASRSESGNMKYDYYLSSDNDDELLLVEKWESPAALAEHGGKDHFKRLGELKSEYVAETVIDRFDI